MAEPVLAFAIIAVIAFILIRLAAGTVRIVGLFLLAAITVILASRTPFLEGSLSPLLNFFSDGEDSAEVESGPSQSAQGFSQPSSDGLSADGLSTDGPSTNGTAGDRTTSDTTTATDENLPTFSREPIRARW